MNYQINYSSILNMKKKNYHIFIFLIIIMLLILIIFSINNKVIKKYETYGLYQNNHLIITINSKLSDKIINNNYLVINNEKIEYNFNSFLGYEINNNEIYQSIMLDINKDLIENEIVFVSFDNESKTIFKYLLNLLR